jgi:hypothetical protein
MDRTMSASRPGDRIILCGAGLMLAAAGILAVPGNAAAQQPPPADQPAFTWDASDPRIGLRPGLTDAGMAARNMRLISNVPRPEGFFNPAAPGDLRWANSDLAFRGNHAIVGNFSGFNIYDIAQPGSPRLIASLVCPGGQGDVSIHGNLVFMSVEETRGRVDCGPQGVQGAVSPERFRGVRIFDISDVANPRQVGAVQSCRGSHTHTLVPHPTDASKVYLYISGTSAPRQAEELPGCSRLGPDEDPQTSLFRIEVVEVPLARPQDARIVSEPRIFADRATGAIAGLWPGGVHGEGTQRTAQTNQCHDITAYPALGLAAGACSGNGILLDIRDPVNPVRIDEVLDPNFAYWHSATFSNDGRTVIFTDEWGGGTSPRCRATDLPTWGANALFERVDGRMRLAGYYKLPVPQTAQENCVAHNGSLVPVPGRDIKVQAWYQGGISVFDFTDPANPFEIAFFDRGPLHATELQTGGHWSAYWYNGLIYGAEIARGLDILELQPSEHLSQAEIDAANLIRFEEFNPQTQPKVEWPVHLTVARAYVDQLERSGALPAARAGALRGDFNRIDGLQGAQRTQALSGLNAAVAQLTADGRSAAAAGRRIDANRFTLLAETLGHLAMGH